MLGTTATPIGVLDVALMMIVYGRKGATIRLSDRLTKAAPKAKLHVMENSGHFPMLDEPSAFAALYIKFCGGK
jgi:pimeloyl-ACP methyl ester carboxylesterase